MSQTLDYKEWPNYTWKLTWLNGCSVSTDDDTVRFTVSGTKVTVAIFRTTVEIHEGGYPKEFTGEPGGKAFDSESKITSSKTDDGWKLHCAPETKKREPATWTAREQ